MWFVCRCCSMASPMVNVESFSTTSLDVKGCCCFGAEGFLALEDASLEEAAAHLKCNFQREPILALKLSIRSTTHFRTQKATSWESDSRRDCVHNRSVEFCNQPIKCDLRVNTVKYITHCHTTGPISFILVDPCGQNLTGFSCSSRFGVKTSSLSLSPLHLPCSTVWVSGAGNSRVLVDG